jgi:uncharacterized secreted protein with C-terminal beta-propeller domain
MKKRILAIFTMLALILSLAACQTSPEEETRRRERSERPDVIGTNLSSSVVSVAASAEDYDQIYELIKAARNFESNSVNRASNGRGLDMAVEAEESFDGFADDAAMPAPMAEAPGSTANYAGEPDAEYSAMGGGGEGGSSFSDTNNQVQGVQESDIVKTDGRYIYTISHYQNSFVNVVRVNNGSMEQVARLEKEGAYPIELLLYDGKLIVIWAKSTWVSFDGTRWDCCCDYYAQYWDEWYYDDYWYVEDDYWGYDDPPTTSYDDEYDIEMEMFEIEPWDMPTVDPIFDYEIEEPVEILADEPALLIEPGYHRSWWGWWGGGWNDNETVVEVYNINGDFKQPESSFSQKGWYSSSRMIDSHIYLITTFSPMVNQLNEFARDDLEAYIPSYTINGDSYYIAPSGIVLPEKLDWVQYTVISGLDVNSPEFFVSSTANLGSSWIIYSSMNNIYITSSVHEIIGRRRTQWGYWDDYKEYTQINKFSINKGQVAFTASGKVAGSVQNQFWLDEHNGVLRVVTQIWEWGFDWEDFYSAGSLYTLDENLNILGEFHGIGETENVQSVRFEGDIGYIVTFLIVDPLFAFDLSDPTNIIMLDELKIPGYSRYMHRWADGLLLGVGVDAEEEFGWKTGLKLSMFCTTDNENLSEKHVFIIEPPESEEMTDEWGWSWGGWSWIWSPAEWDHKPILVSPERNIIGFPYSMSYTSSNMYIDEQKYAIFSYDDSTGFTLIGEIEMPAYSGSQEWFWTNGFTRGLFIDDYLYVVADHLIVSARLDNMQIVQTLRF